jgi:hypothetical protein
VKALPDPRTTEAEQQHVETCLQFALSHLEDVPNAQIIVAVAVPDEDNHLLVRTAISVNSPAWLRSMTAHLNDQVVALLADQCKNDEEEPE